jgi:hypothetical protein
MLICQRLTFVFLVLCSFLAAETIQAQQAHLWRTKKGEWVGGPTVIRMNTLRVSTTEGPVTLGITDLIQADNRYAMREFPKAATPEPPARDIAMTLGEIYENLFLLDGRIVRLRYTFRSTGGRQVASNLWEYQFGTSLHQPALLYLTREARAAWGELQPRHFEEGIYVRVESANLTNQYGTPLTGVKLTAVGRQIQRGRYTW